MNYSALKKAHKLRVIPELREEDLEESFVRGMYNRVTSLNSPSLLYLSNREWTGMLSHTQLSPLTGINVKSIY
jgi:hypothetical protein